MISIEEYYSIRRHTSQEIKRKKTATGCSLDHTRKYGDVFTVEVSGFEPKMSEPKSLVLPLHHTSIEYKDNQSMGIFYC